MTSSRSGRNDCLAVLTRRSVVAVRSYVRIYMQWTGIPLSAHVRILILFSACLQRMMTTSLNTYERPLRGVAR